MITLSATRFITILTLTFNLDKLIWVTVDSCHTGHHLQLFRC